MHTIVATVAVTAKTIVYVDIVDDARSKKTIVAEIVERSHARMCVARGRDVGGTIPGVGSAIFHLTDHAVDV